MFNKINFKKVNQFFKKIFFISPQKMWDNGILKKGSTARVIFFYPGEEGTYIENAQVILFKNGIVHIIAHQEETTTHLQNCEILWQCENKDRIGKIVRLLKPKIEKKTDPDFLPDAP